MGELGGGLNWKFELTFESRVPPYSIGECGGHIVVVIVGAAATRAALTAQGHEPWPVKEFKRGDELLARLFFIQDPDGHKIEMLERHGHCQ